ncbi:Sorting nexin, cytoplasm-to-vacuole targeting pathway/endosomal sorting [Ceratobasidium sp. 370]|nr:Sorting nexin, cytoplasm-to-vacuole targeting pathway/endosomal sorting [Ceratobasidium sp. 370]
MTSPDIGNLRLSTDSEHNGTGFGHAQDTNSNYPQIGMANNTDEVCCARAQWLHSGDEPEILLPYSELSAALQITDAQKSSEGSGSVFIAYVIRSGNSEARRRYSEFESLRNSLSKLYPTLIVPPIPSKQSLGDYAIKQSKAKEDASLIARRRRMLQVFLNRIARHPILSNEHVFHRFLERDVSWSEVLHSPPLINLPKNLLKAPAHNPTESGPAYALLPVPSPSHPLHRPDQRFLDSESFTQKFEAHLNGPLEKVTRRAAKRWSEHSHDTAELGAALNALSLSLPPYESDAVERTGQAVDAAYVGSTKLVQAIESGWTEPLHEYAMFAGIIRRLLVYRHQKHVQYEMTLESLENKRETLEDYERSEAEAQRLATALSAATAPRRPSASPSLTPNNNTVALPGTPPAHEGQGHGQGLSPRLGASPAPSADSLTQSPTQVSIPDAEELDPNDPSGISKTRDSISQLEDTLLVSAQDLKYASSTIQADLDRFQRQKVADIRDMCIAMAIAHREWAKNNLSAWEEAKQEIAKIEPHPNRPPGASDGAGPSSPRP